MLCSSSSSHQNLSHSPVSDTNLVNAGDVQGFVASFFMSLAHFIPRLI